MCTTNDPVDAIKKIIEEHKCKILAEKVRLGIINNNNGNINIKTIETNEICDKPLLLLLQQQQQQHQGGDCTVDKLALRDDNKENCCNNKTIHETKQQNNNKNDPLIIITGGPNLSSTAVVAAADDGNLLLLEKKKQAFIDSVTNSDNPLLLSSSSSSLFRSNDRPGAMLRFGEYSPNNPQIRVSAAAPYIGLGEHEQRKNYFLQKRKAEYLEHLSKKNRALLSLKDEQRVINKSTVVVVSKAVQTEIRNIHTKLIQHELSSLWLKERRDNLGDVVDDDLDLETSEADHLERRRRLVESYEANDGSSNSYINNAQNALLLKNTTAEMDKPKSILSNRRTGSPRERIMSSSSSYTPSFMDGFSYQEDRSEELERERLKRETYQKELRAQIEEKRRMQIMRDDQDRREQELENRRLEQQLLRMQEEQLIEEQRRNRRDEQMRRHSEDLLRRKHDLQSKQHGSYNRKHTESESGCYVNSTNVASKALSSSSHYSPPVSRRNPYSYNIPSTSVFSEPSSSGRYNHQHRLSPSPSRYETYLRKDALNRMDSLNTTSYDYHHQQQQQQHHHHYPQQQQQHSKYNRFSRYDSLSRIDSMNNHQDVLSRIESLNLGDDSFNTTIQRRHSATHQDLSLLRKSPKLQRRSSSSKFDDSLPIPVLKAHSPVAKELKNSVPFNSTRHHHSSEALRKLEDKWQIPAVQKNILNHESGGSGGSNRNILTQLGAIRMQLQQEQIRMDESLRKRGITQSKAVDFH